MRKKQTEIVEPQPGAVLEYLRTAPPSLLQAFELSRLNHVSTMKKELEAILEQMVRELAEASLARVMLEHRKKLLPQKQQNGAASPGRLSEIIEQIAKLPSAEKETNS